MPFSFNPGQQQVAESTTGTRGSNDVPALVVPEAPSIVLTPVVKPVSPLAFRNENTSKMAIYFQFAVFLVFFIIAGISLWLFSYQSTLKIQIANRKSTLEEAQKSFTGIPLSEMEHLSARIALINKIMNERASVRTALTILEESVDKTVTYNNRFTLSKSRNTRAYDVSFGGETNSYTSLYQQLDILKSKIFGTVFKRITIGQVGPLDKKGITSFKVDGTIAIAGVDPDGFTVIHANGEASSTADVSSSTPLGDTQGIIIQDASGTVQTITP